MLSHHDRSAWRMSKCDLVRVTVVDSDVSNRFLLQSPRASRVLFGMRRRRRET